MTAVSRHGRRRTERRPASAAGSAPATATAFNRRCRGTAARSPVWSRRPPGGTGRASGRRRAAGRPGGGVGPRVVPVSGAPGGGAAPAGRPVPPPGEAPRALARGRSGDFVAARPTSAARGRCGPAPRTRTALRPAPGAPRAAPPCRARGSAGAGRRRAGDRS